jgi:TIR domain
MIPAGNDRRRRVPDIFVSYTSTDQAWAFWIGQELTKLGHEPRIHEWEISAGGDIAKWMFERIQKADHVLCVVSDVYLTKDYSGWELRAAQWAAQSSRPNFALPVFIEDCDPPPLLAHIKRCNLFGISEEEAARTRLATYLVPAGKPSEPVRFPGAVPARRTTVAFPGRTLASVLSPVTGRSDGIAHARGVFSAAQLGKTMANPRYADDFSRLDRVYDGRAIINMETVMIVVGNRIPAELLDRPVAESLRDVIDGKGGIEHPFRRAIVLTHSAWSAEAKDVALNAVIAIGSHRANELSKKLQGEPSATKFPVAGRAGCYGLFQKNAAGSPQVALWGDDAKRTRRAVELYVEDETGLNEFLNLIWK